MKNAYALIMKKRPESQVENSASPPVNSSTRERQRVDIEVENREQEGKVCG
jgi:hypothetical protein